MPDYRKIDTDILIIGGGGAAALAALSAMGAGCGVTTVSKETSLLGGASIEAGGGINILNDPEDSPEKFYEDIIQGGAGLNNRRIAMTLAERSRKALLNMEKYGVLLDKVGDDFRKVYRTEGSRYARGYVDRRENLGWCHGLTAALARSDLHFYPETYVTRLLFGREQVAGALGISLATGEYLVFQAKAVLLATGGLGQLYEVTSNSRTLTGDGYAMAWDAGARLVDMEMVQFLPLCFPFPRSRRGIAIGMSSLFGPNVKLYNGLGERYMHRYDPERAEYTTRDIAARGNYTEISEGRGTERGAIVVDPTGNDRSLLPNYRDTHPFIYGRVRDVFGVPAQNWEATFEAMPAQHHFMGGVLIDEECRTDVPGLFAVGEVSGGVQGGNRLGGNGLGEIIVFGDIAGESIARGIKGKKTAPLDSAEIEREIGELEAAFQASPADGIRPFRVKENIQKAMWNYLGPVRSKDGMEKAVSALEEIEKDDLPRVSPGYRQREFNREWMEAVEVKKMLRTALLVVHAALSREESRGSHYRTDFPQADDENWLVNTVAGKSREGEITIDFKPAGA
ncbi:MAG: FAD-binding protein [Chloroflexota bacterium]